MVAAAAQHASSRQVARAAPSSQVAIDSPDNQTTIAGEGGVPYLIALLSGSPTLRGVALVPHAASKRSDNRVSRLIRGA